MKPVNVAILGCGTVGGGVAKILLEINEDIEVRSGKKINLAKIVELNPKTASERFNIPLDVFCGKGEDLTPQQAGNYIEEIIHSDDIDIIVETIGGTSDFVHNLVLSVCNAKKHIITANKALLAERGKDIFQAAKDNNVFLGYEAAVCGAIPIIKTIKESFTGDEVISISGIMNGTSNYILSMMQDEGLDFDFALKLAQDNGYAEADPTLDISGGDAGHKLVILMKLAFGLDVDMESLSITGIQNISKEDIEYAEEIGSRIKLICFAKKADEKIYATVCPMMVKKSNFLSEVNGATNAVRVTNKYSGKHILVGEGAGSSETASSIVADIVFAARYAGIKATSYKISDLKFVDAKHFDLPYIIAFHTTDKPGTTGIVTTSIGKKQINIDTVSHNRHKPDKATFSVATMPCSLQQIEDAIEEINLNNPGILLTEPKIIPILK